MKLTQAALAAVVAVLILASCGQPNISDTPGAAPAASNTPAPTQAAPTPTAAPAPTAAAITTPCTKGKTITTPNGVKVTDAKCGKGAEATRGSTIKVLYVGKLSSGKVFDASSRHGNKPLKILIGQGAVIPGWDEAVPGMRVGGVRDLTIPPAMAYGSSGAGTAIPPNATIEFRIKLVGVTHG
ncbi:MAG: FKBP-type peptidyl-prolyl cis-trans isomerase FkpA [Actinomycetota bacterium]|jgi:FKBP-type peptidyl-prolyl cis-trans isomerase|nr:FKBP-type peptidyl-prolyl cis-trans isomerase FkpA [Actinomycetota bacterium]